MLSRRLEAPCAQWKNPMFNRHQLVPSACAALLAWAMSLTIASAQSAPAGATQKYKVNVPPPAELSYKVRARQSSLLLEGGATVRWTVANKKFELTSETRSPLVGKILETKSAGVIDEYGLAPTTFSEKRFRKDRITTSFDRAAKKINFGDGSTKGYPLKGGEQDRNSALWQLISIARAAPAQFKPGSEWTFVVAGHSDAEPWVFKVLQRETVSTPAGDMSAIHVSRASPPESKDQKLDIWLAPSLEWYPVRLRFAESSGDFIEQALEKAPRQPS
jgi:hypothetical protein